MLFLILLCLLLRGSGVPLVLLLSLFTPHVTALVFSGDVDVVMLLVVVKLL